MFARERNISHHRLCRQSSHKSILRTPENLTSRPTKLHTPTAQQPKYQYYSTSPQPYKESAHCPRHCDFPSDANFTPRSHHGQVSTHPDFRVDEPLCGGAWHAAYCFAEVVDCLDGPCHAWLSHRLQGRWFRAFKWHPWTGWRGGSICHAFTRA